MASIYTLSDGTQMKLADGLTDEQVIAVAEDRRNESMFRTRDLEDIYDISSGVRDAELRLSLSLADKNPNEIKLILDDQVGADNWGYTSTDQLYITPKGLARKGIQAEKATLVDGMDTTVYDLVDVVPEIVKGVGALGAEILLPMIPGSGIIARGALSGLVSRSLLAGSTRAGLGDMAANIGLETYQSARGENTESVGDIFTKAGIEGLVVAGASIALGMPFKLAGKLGGKISNVAKDKLGKTTSNGINVTPTTAQAAREEAVDLLKASGKYSDAEIEKLVPVITIKHMIGDQGNLSSKFAVILEGVGSKNLGDKLPADALVFLQKFDDLYRAGQASGKSTVEIVEQMKNSLTKKELDLLFKTQKIIDDFYGSVGAKTEVARDVSYLTGLIGKNIQSQYKYGAKKFNEMYAELDLEGLTSFGLSRGQVATLVNNIAKSTGGTVDEVMGDLRMFNAGIANRISKVVDIKNNVAVPVKIKKSAKKEAEFSEETRLNAKDLLDLSRSLRQQMTSKSLSGNIMRKAVHADSTLMSELDKVVGAKFGKDLKLVNSNYKEFITPFKKSFKYLESTTAQNPETYVRQLMTGSKETLFTDLVEQLDQVLKGTDSIGGKGVDVLDTDTLLAKIGTQYMRWVKGRFGLDNIEISVGAVPEIRRRAKAALKMLDDLENKGENTVKYKKAFKRVFNNKGFNDYKKALKQIADGNPEGIGKLQQALSYKEAEQFINKVAQLGDNLSGSGKLMDALADFRAYKAVDPDGSAFYSDLLYTQVYSRLLKIGGLDSAVKNGALKKWAEDIVTANNMNKEALKELLGANYKPMMQMGNIIQGAFNIDPTAGAISAAGLPIGAIRGVLNASVVGAMRPLSLMYTMKSFGPGQAGWKKINMLVRKGVPQDKIDDQMRPYMRKTLNAAKKAAAVKMSGQNGLLAATVSAYMDEADESLPQENDPAVKKISMNLEEEKYAQVQAEQSVAQQDLGQNMMAVMASLQNAQGAPQQAVSPQSPAALNSVAQGTRISQGVKNAQASPTATAIPVNITANSIPNSFANLMGSINVSGRG